MFGRDIRQSHGAGHAYARASTARSWSGLNELQGEFTYDIAQTRISNNNNNT